MDDAPAPLLLTPGRRAGRLGAALLVLLALWLGTLRDGHAWGGDNAMYLMHARNLVAGVPYADTGYVYNPTSRRFPPSYPPVFPLMLAPVVAATDAAEPPIDWMPMKWLTTASLFGALALLLAHERRRLPEPLLWLLLGWVGLNPLLYDFRDAVLSELPFLLFVAAALWLADRRADGARGVGDPPSIAAGVGLGVLVYLAYGTRSVGALLLPALLLADLVRLRRLRRTTLLALLVFAPLAGLQNLLVHSETGHLLYKLAQLEPSLPWTNLSVRYPELFHGFWSSGRFWLPGAVVALVAAGLLGYGLTVRAAHSLRGERDGLDTLDLYVLVSLAFLLAIRLDDMTPPHRYWIPLFPLLAAQVARGALALWRVHPSRALMRAGVALAAASLAAYGLRAHQLDDAAIERGIASPDALALYAFLRANTAPDDVLLFFEPRVLALYTGRRASELRVGGNRAEWMDWAERVGARYWVRPGGLPGHYRDALTLVYRNERFGVFRFDAHR